MSMTVDKVWEKMGQAEGWGRDTADKDIDIHSKGRNGETQVPGGENRMDRGHGGTDVGEDGATRMSAGLGRQRTACGRRKSTFHQPLPSQAETPPLTYDTPTHTHQAVMRYWARLHDESRAATSARLGSISGYVPLTSAGSH